MKETVVIEHLDFEVPCAQPDPETHAATHSATCRSCSVVEFVCEEHLSRIDTLILQGWALRCRACGVSTAIGITALYTVVPL